MSYFLFPSVADTPATESLLHAYEGLLGRFPDQAGFTYWANQLSNGTSLSNIISAFTQSAEIGSHAAGNKQFVDYLYSTALLRNPDVSGEAYWTSNLDSGHTTKAQVAQLFLQSSEFSAMFQPFNASTSITTTSGATTSYSTSGTNIVNASGVGLTLNSTNWYGAEGTAEDPQGLYSRGYEAMLDQIKTEHFNTIRLPFSQDTIHSTSTVVKTYDSNGNYTGLSLNGSYISPTADGGQNNDLLGLTPLQIMDKIVQYADKIGLNIILDHHRMSAGDGTQNGLWYIPGSTTYTIQSWEADWQMLAARYAGDKSVIGGDLQNEPYAATWGDGGTNDWAAAATTAGNMVLAKNPNWLIVVEGIQTYAGNSYFWGGNLMGVQSHPITLNVSNKLVYSPHDYGPSVANQTWFSASNYPNNLPAIYDQYWGYIYKNNVAPIWVGEMGGAITPNGQVTQTQATGTQQYLTEITSYMATGGTMTTVPVGKTPISWAQFAWNNVNSDVQGILNSDWTTINTQLYNYLKFS